MTYQDFIAGKYGISHGVIAVALIGIGTLLGGVYGNLFFAGGAVGAYYMREVVQHNSWNPMHWNWDGRLDAFMPLLVVGVNIAGLVWVI